MSEKPDLKVVNQSRTSSLELSDELIGYLRNFTEIKLLSSDVLDKILLIRDREQQLQEASRIITIIRKIVKAKSDSVFVKEDMQKKDEPEVLKDEVVKRINQRRLEALMRKAKFTKRESEIFNLLIQGLTIDYIAAKLRISCRTVKFHSSNIYQKLGADNLRDLFRVIYKNFFQ